MDIEEKIKALKQDRLMLNWEQFKARIDDIFSDYQQSLLEGIDKLPTMREVEITSTANSRIDKRLFPLTAQEYKDQVEELIGGKK